MFIELLEDRQMFSTPAAPSPVPIPYPTTTVVDANHKADGTSAGNVAGAWILAQGHAAMMAETPGSTGFGGSPTLMTATSNQR